MGASYSGVCVLGTEATATDSSGDNLVLGVEASAGNGTRNRAGTSAGLSGVVSGDSGSGTGGLGGTGVDAQTELYALLGAGMVAVGGLTLLARRRRLQA